MIRKAVHFLLSAALAACFFGNVSAQTTEFTYQGSLRDGASAANGSYDFEFVLCDAVTGGNQLGSTATRSAVAVSNGSFAVKLDFGSQFTGATRFLEIHVRPAGGGNFTILSPRQQISNEPYSIRSLNAANSDSSANALQLGGVAASQYVTTTNGPTNFIQNTTNQQSSANFNISGNGTVDGTLSGNVINASTQFNLNGSRILSQGANFDDLYVGLAAGTGDSSPGDTFVGACSAAPCFNNRAGNWNSFFGAYTGSFALSPPTFGGTDTRTTLLGYGADAFNNDGTGHPLTNVTAIGTCAFVSKSNSLVLGGVSGSGSICTGQDANVGIGTTAPSFKLHVIDSSNTGLRVQTNISGGTVASFGGNGVFQIDKAGINGGRFTVLENGNVGIGTNAPTTPLQVNGSVRVTSGAVIIANPNTVIITSPNGACWGITVNNAGALSTFPVSPCP